MSKSISKTKETLKDQGKRFSEVLEYLKTGAKERKNNSDVISDINDLYQSSLINSDFSKFKKGEEIPEYVLDALYKLYYINPDYILGKSECMVDFFAEFIDKIKSKKVDESESKTIVEPDLVVTDEDKDEEIKFLSIKMDSRFFDYITSVSPEILVSPYTKEKRYSNSFVMNEKERNKIISEIQGKKELQYKMYILVPEEDVINTNYYNDLLDFKTRLALLEEKYELLKKEVGLWKKEKPDETDKMVDETDKMVDETDKKVDETDKMVDETDKKVDETDKMVDEIKEKIEEIRDLKNRLSDFKIVLSEFFKKLEEQKKKNRNN